MLAIGLQALAACTEGANPSLLGGMASALAQESDAAFEALLSEIAQVESLKQFTVYLASVHLSPFGIELIVKGILNNDFQPEAAQMLGMGRVLEPLPRASVNFP